VYPEKYHNKKQNILICPKYKWGTIISLNNEDINTVLTMKTKHLIDCGTDENYFIELSKIFLNYNLLTKKQIVNKLKNMKVEGNITPIRCFSFMVLMKDNNTNKLKPHIIVGHFKWKCIEHKNGIKDYYCKEYVNEIMNIKNVMEIF
jgi:hypothetical protein